MSDHTPPPPPSSSPPHPDPPNPTTSSFPPAPPVSIAPPPGYAGYQGPDFRQGGLGRLGGLAKAIVILLVVVAIGQAIALATSSSVRDGARIYLDNGDDDAFNEKLVANGLGSLLGGLATVAVIVCSIIWLRRLVQNHQALGRLVTWTPGWAIAGWFLPPFLFVIPLLLLRESWKASNPQEPAGSTTWKNGEEGPLPWVWFLTYSVAPLVLAILGSRQLFASFDRDLENIANNIVDNFGLTVLSGVVSILGTISWGLLVWALTKRHTQLTGEATAR